MPEPHVQIIVDRQPLPLPLRAALNRLGARVSIRSLGKAADAGVSASADVCVILPDRDHSSDLLDRILDHAAGNACATLVLDGEHSSFVAADPSVPGRPDTDDVLRRLPAPEAMKQASLSTDELTGRIKALCEIRRPLRRMHDELTRLRGVQQTTSVVKANLDDQLRLAGQVQTDLLPAPLLDASPLTITTLYRPADYISGDIYDISRLDETHFGFSIADATGHGLPAALLTFLIRNSLRGKEIFDHAYRIVGPGELLGRLNDDLLHASLSHCQFITALHAVFDRGSGRLSWARGGSPYPILVRRGEPARLVRSEGGLIGAFSQEFEVVHHDMQPGDVVVFYTDGLDALLLDRHADGPRTLLETDWCRVLESEGPAAALNAIETLLANCPISDWHHDDITVIALQMN